MLAFTWDKNNYMCFLQWHSIPLVNESTLCSQNLHINWRCYNWPNVCIFTFPILHNSKVCYLRCSSSKTKELPWSTPHWSIPPCSHWSIWVFTRTCICVLTRLCQCNLELKKARRAFPFCHGYFFSLKNFNCVTMDVNILHFKSSNDSKPSYFPASAPSKHTSHAMIDLLQAVGYWDGEFLTCSLC
jgi:hypothetical protein